MGNRRDTLTEYVAGLNWDGTQRIGTWLRDYMQAIEQPEEYVALVGRKMLIAGIARALRPGCRADQMVVLEGGQGVGKSRAVRALAPVEDWYQDQLPDVSKQYKDAKIALFGKWIVEVAEMEAIRKADREAVKRFLSNDVDMERLPYDRLQTAHPRRCIFIGTHNPTNEGWLLDPTGNRRYLPVAVGSVDVDGIEAVRDQLWAEAKAAYLAGERWWTEPSDPFVLEQQKARFRMGEWAELAFRYLEESPSVVNPLDKDKVLEWQDRPEKLTIFIPKYFWQDIGEGNWLKVDWRIRNEINGAFQNAGWDAFHGRVPEQAKVHGDSERNMQRGWRANERKKLATVDTPAEGLCSHLVANKTDSENKDLGGDGYKDTNFSSISLQNRNIGESCSARGARVRFFEKGVAMYPCSQNPQVVESRGDLFSAVATPVATPSSPTYLRLAPTDWKVLQEFISTADGPIAFDLETTSLHPRSGRARLCQMSRNGTDILIDLDEWGGLEVLALFLEEADLVVFNATFEGTWFKHAGVRPRNLYDAKLAVSAIRGGTCSLAQAAKEFLGVTLDKSYQTSNWEGALTPAQLEYAITDARVTMQLWQVLVPLMDQHDVWDGFWLLNDAVPAVVEMQDNGVQFDLRAHTGMIGEMADQSSELERELRDLAPSVDNWNSPKQIGEWINQHLDTRQRRAWPRSEKSNELAINRPAIEQAMERGIVPTQIADALDVYLQRQKLSQYLKTFGESLAEQVIDGRLHGRLHVSQAITGRMSSSDPNLQNLPRGDFRALFTSPEGRSLVCADYSQIEVRVGGLLADEPVIADAFAAGHDIHQATASLMTGKDYDKVTKEERRQAKAITFGMQYGMGTKKLAESLKWSMDEATKQIATWEKTYPMVAVWRKRQANQGAASYELRTAGGRRIALPTNHSPSVCYNYPVQGSAGDVMYSALAKLNDALKEVDGAKLLLVVHDEVLVECEDKDIEQVKGIVERAMVAGFLSVFPGGGTTGLVDAHAAKTWAEAKG